ncbi:nuclear transport factor 2 family protein [Streptomyces sp. HPF1205]|uniref:nuclear transport factor 2 family protein n=1 Tax=Streptomyces sp. HPF1205 TaxID=2873262 RepID=UPI001CED2140|nr:nuclear transport factor 2 family protein [Streptomyces sp. HPF1205]
MAKDNGDIVDEFVSLFAKKDTAQLAPYLHPDIEFEAYGDTPVKGRDNVLALWNGVFRQMGEVEFLTIHQAVDGEIVLAEQVHGLALPGRPLARIKNMAVYRLAAGQIVEWRDYTNPQYAQTLL